MTVRSTDTAATSAAGDTAASGSLLVAHLGRCEYGTSLAIQERGRDAVLAGGRDRLLLVEHPPVITLGRGADERHVLAPAAPVVRVNRGGDVTYHGPGQLVGYPIVDLARVGCDIDRYLRALESTLIAVAASYGIRAGRRPGFTGVWVGNDKLAAIGVGIRRWVTMHGFALNVADLRDAFAAIVPCGLTGCGVTSLEQLTGTPPPLADVEARVVAAFARELGYRTVGAVADAASPEQHPASMPTIASREAVALGERP